MKIWRIFENTLSGFWWGLGGCCGRTPLEEEEREDEKAIVGELELGGT